MAPELAVTLNLRLNKSLQLKCEPHIKRKRTLPPHLPQHMGLTIDRLPRRPVALLAICRFAGPRKYAKSELPQASY